MQAGVQSPTNIHLSTSKDDGLELKTSPNARGHAKDYNNNNNNIIVIKIL
jgi:hypothetical protein